MFRFDFPGIGLNAMGYWLDCIPSWKDVRTAHFFGLLLLALSLASPGLTRRAQAAPTPALVIQTTNDLFQPEIHFNPDSPQDFF